MYGNCFSVRTWIMVRPTAPVAPTTATVSFSGLVSGTVRPSSYGLSGTAASIPAGLGPARPPRDGRAQLQARARARTQTSAGDVGEGPRGGCRGSARGARSGRSGAEAGRSGSWRRRVDRSRPRGAAPGPRRARRGHRLDRGVVLGAEHEVAARSRAGAGRSSDCVLPARPEADQALGRDALSAGLAGGAAPAVTPVGRDAARTGPAPAPPPRTGPAGSGRIPNVRSRRPAPPGPRRPWSGASESWTSTPGQHARRTGCMIAGRTRAPTLGYTPTRSVPILARGIGEEVRAGGLEPVRDRDDVAQEQLPRLGQRHGPPPAAASNRRTPSAVSSAATCWLTADCV